VRFFGRHELPEDIVLPAIRPIRDYLNPESVALNVLIAANG